MSILLASQPMEVWICMQITCTDDKTPHDVLRETLSSFGERFAGNTIDLAISHPCGGGVTLYKTIDDVPEIDVPCPCGNPNHWIVKIIKEEKK